MKSYSESSYFWPTAVEFWRSRHTKQYVLDISAEWEWVWGSEWVVWVCYSSTREGILTWGIHRLQLKPRKSRLSRMVTLLRAILPTAVKTSSVPPKIFLWMAPWLASSSSSSCSGAVVHLGTCLFYHVRDAFQNILPTRSIHRGRHIIILSQPLMGYFPCSRCSYFHQILIWPEQEPSLFSNTSNRTIISSGKLHHETELWRKQPDHRFVF